MEATGNAGNSGNAGGFQPKIVAFICNWCTSVFFFGAPAMRAGPRGFGPLAKSTDERTPRRECGVRKEKRLGKKKLGPAFLPGRSLASLGMRGD